MCVCVCVRVRVRVCVRVCACVCVWGGDLIPRLTSFLFRRVALGRYYFDAGVYAFPQAGLLEKGAASTMAYRINDWVRTLEPDTAPPQLQLALLHLRGAHIESSCAKLPQPCLHAGRFCLCCSARRIRSFGKSLQLSRGEIAKLIRSASTQDTTLRQSTAVMSGAPASSGTTSGSLALPGRCDAHCGRWCNGCNKWKSNVCSSKLAHPFARACLLRNVRAADCAGSRPAWREQ